MTTEQSIPQFRVKNQGNKTLIEKQRRDWTALINAHPQRFDALLFRPEVSAGMTGPLINLEQHESPVSYADPVPVVCVESPNQDPHFIANWDGDANMGYGESSSIVLRCSELNIPETSAIEFLVDKAGIVTSQRWYVIEIIPVGDPAIGFLYHCIPMGDPNSIQQAGGHE